MIKVKESELEERKSEIETLEKKIADRDKVIGFYQQFITDKKLDKKLDQYKDQLKKFDGYYKKGYEENCPLQ